MENTSKISILYLIDTLIAVGGSEKHLIQLLAGLDQTRYKFSVCTFQFTNNDIIKKLHELGIPLYNINYKRVFTFGGFIKSYQLFKLIRRLKPDIIETYHHSADTIGVFIARLAGVQIIISNKRDLAIYKTKFQIYFSKIANQWITSFIAVCKSVANHYIEKEKIDENKVTVIYNGIDTTAIRPIESSVLNKLRNRLSIKKDNFVLACVANLRPEKGHIVLLEALRILHEKGIKSLKCLIIGSGNGPYASKLATVVKLQNLAEHVVFTGYVKNVNEYIAISDICCLPATSNEGFSNAIIEQMALGKPVIATRIGGNEEAIVHGETGFIVPANDPNAIAESIEWFMQNKKELPSMAENSVRRVREHFSFLKKAKKTENLYRQLLGQQI